MPANDPQPLEIWRKRESPSIYIQIENIRNSFEITLRRIGTQSPSWALTRLRNFVAEFEFVSGLDVPAIYVPEDVAGEVANN